MDDVCWSWACESVYYSVGDDKQVLVWDRRQEGPAMGIEQAHSQEIMCVDTTPFDGNLVLTGSMDSQVKLWDQRNPQDPVHIFSGHTEDVT